MDWYRNLVCASSFGGRGESDVPVDVDEDPDAKSPKGSSVFCGGEDGSLSPFYDMGPVVMGREVVEKGPPGVVVEAVPREQRGGAREERAERGWHGPIAERIVEHHLDSTFLESLDGAAAEETLEDLGATDRLVKRRVAFELKLAAL